MYPLVTVSKSAQVKGFYTAFRFHADPAFVFRGETHELYELAVVESGSIGVTAGTETLTLGEGSAVLHPPMEFHSWHTLGEQPAVVTIFAFMADKTPKFDKRIFVLSDRERNRTAKILTLLHEATEHGTHRLLHVIEGKEGKMEEAIAEFEILLLHLQTADERTFLSEDNTGSCNYQRALGVLKANLTKPLNTAELASLCHMSPSLLKKIFARYAGVGVMEYFRTQKILAAIPHLQNGKSVSETAFLFGFTDAGYFSTVFKRITGHTPGFYRNK